MKCQILFSRGKKKKKKKEKNISNVSSAEFAHSTVSVIIFIQTCLSKLQTIWKQTDQNVHCLPFRHH